MESSYTAKRNKGWQSEFQDTKSYLWGRISCLQWSLPSGAVNQRCMFWCLQQTVAQTNTGTENTHTHTENRISLFKTFVLKLYSSWPQTGVHYSTVLFLLYTFCATVWNLSWYSSVPLPPLSIHKHANITHTHPASVIHIMVTHTHHSPSTPTHLISSLNLWHKTADVRRSACSVHTTSDGHKVGLVQGIDQAWESYCCCLHIHKHTQSPPHETTVNTHTNTHMHAQNH